MAESSRAQDPAGGEDEEAAAAMRDVEITGSGVEDHDVWGPGAYVVRYKVTNGGNEAADYFVGLEFLDKDGDVLGSTGVTADKLGPGKTKEADAAPLEAEIENGEIADIRSVRVSEVQRTPAA
ncbi:FxLYD domain-containing protein [Streptomyces sp. NPDC059637]|uniref:FxLYD domain-containing protein n=1 Tax=Streptomyces TaxID=1883 RepID=UPI0031DA25AE